MSDLFFTLSHRVRSAILFFNRFNFYWRTILDQECLTNLLIYESFHQSVLRGSSWVSLPHGWPFYLHDKDIIHWFNHIRKTKQSSSFSVTVRLLCLQIPQNLQLNRFLSKWWKKSIIHFNRNVCKVVLSLVSLCHNIIFSLCHETKVDRQVKRLWLIPLNGISGNSIVKALWLKKRFKKGERATRKSDII